MSVVRINEGIIIPAPNFTLPSVEDQTADVISMFAVSRAKEGFQISLEMSKPAAKEFPSCASSAFTSAPSPVCNNCKMPKLQSGPI